MVKIRRLREPSEIPDGGWSRPSLPEHPITEALEQVGVPTESLWQFRVEQSLPEPEYYSDGCIKFLRVPVGFGMPGLSVLYNNPFCAPKRPEKPKASIGDDFIDVPVPECNLQPGQRSCAITFSFGKWTDFNGVFVSQYGNPRYPHGTSESKFIPYAGNFRKACEQKDGLRFIVDASPDVFNKEIFNNGKRVHPNFRQWEEEGRDPSVGSVIDGIVIFQRGIITDSNFEVLPGKPPDGGKDRDFGYKIERFTFTYFYRCEDISNGVIRIRKPKILFEEPNTSFINKDGLVEYPPQTYRLYDNFPWTFLGNSCDSSNDPNGGSPDGNNPNTEEPPPPPEKRRCCMSCCPSHNNETANIRKLLQLILSRIGTPVNIDLTDTDPKKLGLQGRKVKPSTLFQGIKLSTERTERTSELTGTAAFPMELPKTMVKTFREGKYGKIYDFMPKNDETIKVNSVAELLKWMLENDSAVIGQFQQVIEFDIDGDGKTDQIVLPNIAETLKEIILLLAQMAKVQGVQTEALFRTAVQSADNKVQISKAVAIGEDIQDYLDYTTKTTTSMVPTAVDVPDDLQDIERTEDYKKFLKNSTEKIIHEVWDGKSSFNDALTDLLTLASTLRALSFQRIDRDKDYD